MNYRKYLLVILVATIFAGCERETVEPYLLTLFIEKQDQYQGMYKTARRIYSTKEECNIVANKLNQEKPSVWLKNMAEFKLKYARCDLIPKTMGNLSIHHTNLSLDQNFLGDI